MSELLNAYTFHGLSFTLEGENAKAECPFCGKADHFYVKVKTGQFNCRRCQTQGNLFSFLEELWRVGHSANGKNAKRLQSLSDDRGIIIEELISWGTVVSPIDPATYLLPSYNVKGRLANLAKLVKVEGKWKVYGTPTCKLHPFGTNLLQKQNKVLWVCEGPWDAMALRAALHTVRSPDDSLTWIAHNGAQIAGKTHGVIAVPGAGTFAPEWLQYFNGKDVRICYDNDHPQKNPSGEVIIVKGKKIQPGWDGMQRVLKIARDEDCTPEKIQVLVWGKGGYDAELSDGYDIRDLLADEELTTPQALSYLCSRLAAQPKLTEKVDKNAPVEIITPIGCESFSELCGHYAQHLYLSDAMRDTLAVSIATVISTNLDGEQLFFRIIGPPGSGKTTIAECLSVAKEFCFPKSIVTGFHSGFTGGVGGAKKDASLIPEMNGKCVIIKDADTLLNAGNKDTILAELRDIYDGCSRSHYRNKKRGDFENLRNTFLLCGTDALRSLNRSFLGERFLDCDILGDADTAKYLTSAVASQFAALQHSLTGASNEAKGIHKKLLKQATYGFLLNIHQRIRERKIVVPTATKDVEIKLENMAKLLSATRAKVERDREELIYRPRLDVSTRPAQQFVKLAVCLAIVMGKPTVDKDIMRICVKVMLDSSYGFCFEIAEFLFARPSGASTAIICAHLGLAQTTVHRMTSDMCELGIVSQRQETNRSGVGGRQAHYFHLSRELRELFKLSSIPKKAESA